MNLKLISLIILIVLSVSLFLFISYAELSDGVGSLVGGGNNNPIAVQASRSILTEGMINAMDAIDKIV